MRVMSIRGHDMLLTAATRLTQFYCRQSSISGIPGRLGRQVLERKHLHAHQMLKTVGVVAGSMSDKLLQDVEKTTVNRADFAQSLNLKALRVQAKQCQGLMKKFAG